MGALGLLAVPITATAMDPQTPAISVISPQYQPPTAGEMAAQAAAVVADAQSAVAVAAAPPQAQTETPSAPLPPSVAPAPATSDSGINSPVSDTSDTHDLPPVVSAPSTSVVAPARAPEPAQAVSDATPVASPAQQVIPPPAANATQTPVSQAIQTESPDVAAAAAAAGEALVANLNVVIRVNSPGNDGAVTQANTVAAPAAAASGPARPEGTGVSVTPSAAGTLPLTWIWNWNWSPAGCAAGGASQPQSAISAGTWTWNWNWGCAPAPPPLHVSIPLPLPVMPVTEPSDAGVVDTPPARSDAVQNVVPPTQPAATPGPRITVDTASRNPFVQALRAGAKSAARATSVATSASATSPRLIGPSSRDGLPPIGVIAPAAAAVASAGPSGTGTGLVAAALLAMLAFVAPQLLLPLRTASARRPGNTSSRRERPG